MLPKTIFSRKLQNDLTIALGIMMLFSAINTQIRIQKLITVSIQHDSPSYATDGYVMYGIMFTVLSITVWLSPAIVHICGLRPSLIMGALGSVPLSTFFYFEDTYLTYISAAISGFATGVLWTAQAVYVVMNSEVGNVYASVAIFAIVFQLSQLLGNGIIYFQFTDTSRLLDRTTRRNIALILLTFVLSSVFILYLLRPAIRESEEESAGTKRRFTFLGQIRMAFDIVTTKQMMLACIYFAFIGMGVTYMNLICTSFGFSKFLSDNSKQFAPLAGMAQGIGETIGGATSFYLNKRSLFARTPFVPLGCLAYLIATIIITLGLPDMGVYAYTDQLPLVRIPIAVLMFANILVGCSDAYLHIEAYSYIGTSYPHNSAPAFAVLKFTRYTASAVSFYYGNLFGLQMQSAILLVLNALSAVSYFYLTSDSMKKKQEQVREFIVSKYSFAEETS